MNRFPNTIEGLIEYMEKVYCNFKIKPNMSKDEIMWNAGRADLVQNIRYHYERASQFEKEKDIILKGE